MYNSLQHAFLQGLKSLEGPLKKIQVTYIILKSQKDNCGRYRAEDYGPEDHIFHTQGGQR